MDESYLTGITYFVNLLRDHQNSGTTRDILWSFEFGRKYDKILRKMASISDGTDAAVIYFVERKTGNIYGARSNTTPHTGWYFGNLNRCHLWDWSGHHGVPVHDPDIRPIKTYGPFIHYRLV